MGQANVTIEHVAQAAGVSRQTVSRVINQASNVSQSARTKVNAAIAELGYVPNLAARRMGGARSFTVLALLSADQNGRSSNSALPLGEMLRAGLSVCRAAGYHLLFEELPSQDPANSLPALIAALQPDGVVVLPPLDSDRGLAQALQQAIAAKNCAVIRMGQARPVLDPPHKGATRSTRGNAQVFDPSYLVQSATERLLALGHKQIGFVAGGGDKARSAMRMATYSSILARAGSRAHGRFVTDPTPRSFAMTTGLARSWLIPTIRPTAIITETASDALIFHQTAKELGVEMPSELSLIALEDEPLLASAQPAITALELPYEELFAHACQALITSCHSSTGEAAEPPMSPEPTRLIERASVTQAPRVV